MRGSVQATREAAITASEDHPDKAKLLNLLGVKLGNQFSKTKSMADISEAIQVIRQAAEMTPDGQGDKPAYLNNLGCQVYKKFLSTDEIQDLNESLRLSRQAVGSTSNLDPNWVIFAKNLGIRLNDRYFANDSISDLEESIEIYRKVVSKTPKDHSDRAERLYSLAERLNYKYTEIKALKDLEECIQVHREAMDIQANDSPDRPEYLRTFMGYMEDRFLVTGVQEDLEEAIQSGRKALEMLPEHHPDRIKTQHSLGRLLIDLYRVTGMLTYLEESIQCATQVVESASDDDPKWIEYLNHLGNRWSTRYLRTGAISDLNGSIRAARRALEATPYNHHRLSQHLHNLSIGLLDRYRRTEDPSDLEESIKVMRKALGVKGNDSNGRAVYLHGLAVQLGYKYSSTKETEDLEEAIDLSRQCVDSTPENDRECPKRMNTLGNHLNRRYLDSGTVFDLETSIELARRAVDITPHDHVDRAAYLSNLGAALYDRYLEKKVATDLEEAVTHQQAALNQTSSPIIHRINGGATALSICKDWPRAYEIASATVALVPQLSSRSLENSDKQHALGQIVGLASIAAAAALNAGQAPLVALNLLETGRGVLGASLEEIRTDDSDLRMKHPHLADRFASLQSELETPATTNSLLIQGRESSWEAPTTRRIHAAKEFDELVEDIRKLPGFGIFLSSPSEKDIQDAARRGPIVVINISIHRCDALLIEKDQIRALPLERLLINDVDARVQEADFGSPSSLEWLWDAITGPILDALGFTKSSSGEEWPHVWWVPTGWLTMFPLHAAGYHNRPGDSVMDRVMSSYSTSVRTIIRTRQSHDPSTVSNKALLVSMQHTPGNNTLPYTNKEVAVLHDLCKQLSLNPIEPERRKNEIIEHLKDCRIFHFAGHGYTDDKDPSKSHLRLEDWRDDPLEIADLLTINLRQSAPFLAYLSACGTSRIKNDRFTDENVHLINACQLVGFRHVIGTLWEVNDEMCVDMASATYESMASHGMTDDSVCLGLHMTTRSLRNRWLEARTTTEGSRVGLEKKAGGTARDASRDEPKDGPLARDVVAWEDDAVVPAPWIPYVHFGC